MLWVRYAHAIYWSICYKKNFMQLFKCILFLALFSYHIFDCATVCYVDVCICILSIAFSLPQSNAVDGQSVVKLYLYSALLLLLLFIINVKKTAVYTHC